jgi:hypothetical protein
MGTLFVADSMAYLVPVFWTDRELLRHCGLGFREVRACKRPPGGIGRSDFLLWAGEAGRLPRLPRNATGRIRSRKTGGFGLVHGRTAADLRLLLSRWEEVEAAGDDVLFTGSVSEGERGTDELCWVMDRLVQTHSFSCLRQVDWGRIERGARRRIDSARDAQEHFRAWEWLFAQLRDGHTRLVAIEGANACSRVHCGVYGRFEDRHRFRVEWVAVGSAAEEAGIAPGDEVIAVNGRDWPAYLRQETMYWVFSTPHVRRACLRFVPWHQPAGTRLELELRGGRRTLTFGEESYRGFFHWTCEGRPEPAAFTWLGPGRYRLRIAYFAGDNEFVSFCRAALREMPRGAELELDLRGNAGGNRIARLKVAGMFLPRGAPLARRRLRRVGGSFTAWAIHRNPDRPVYRGPLTALMDELCASSTETVLGALKAAGRARLIGRRSAGSSGNPRLFLSPGGVRFTCSSWEETTPSGEPIEGHGISPRA